MTVDLILSIADSENLKIFSLSGGSDFASPLDAASESEGGERSSLTRVHGDLAGNG